MTLSTSMPLMHVLMLQWQVNARPQEALLVPQRENRHQTHLRNLMTLVPWMLWPQKPSRRSHQRRRTRN